MDSSASYSGTTGLGALPDSGPRVLEVGQVIDHFRLEERLHQGGMAALWRVSRVHDDGAPMQHPIRRFEYLEGTGLQ